jgi:hypothetical protein
LALLASLPAWTSAEPQPVSKGHMMRTFGFAILGLVAGLVLGFVVIEVVARAALPDGGNPVESVPLPLALMLGFGPFLFAVIGAVAAPLIDQRVRQTRRRSMDQRFEP